MYEVLINGRPTGETFKGRSGYRRATALARDMATLFTRSKVYVARVA